MHGSYRAANHVRTKTVQENGAFTNKIKEPFGFHFFCLFAFFFESPGTLNCWCFLAQQMDIQLNAHTWQGITCAIPTTQQQQNALIEARKPRTHLKNSEFKSKKKGKQRKYFLANLLTVRILQIKYITNDVVLLFFFCSPFFITDRKYGVFRPVFFLFFFNITFKRKYTFAWHYYLHMVLHC